MSDGLISPEGNPASATLLRVQAAGLSDVGRKRVNNEDSFGYDLHENVFIVCDGMGGMAAGEIASSLAVERALETYRDPFLHAMQPEERLHAAVSNANRAVWHMAQSRRELRGMGTTLVAACVDGNHIVVGNVGDSRAYFLRDGGCVQITEDHSYRAEQGRDGAIPAQFITRAIGAGPVVKPDFFAAELRPGDTVLLTTDGLTRYVDADALAGHVQQARNLDEICHSLVAIVHAEGADDNVTCLLLRVL